jgi:hypothetical protein
MKHTSILLAAVSGASRDGAAMAPAVGVGAAARDAAVADPARQLLTHARSRPENGDSGGGRSTGGGGGWNLGGGWARAVSSVRKREEGKKY